MKPDQMKYEVKIPQGVTLDINEGVFTIKGPKGEITRAFIFPKITITKEKTDGSDAVVFFVKKPTKREKAAMFTTEAHLKNMFKGVLEGVIYKLKICSGHFPMKVTLKGDVLEVKNYMGETVPRTIKIKKGADVKIAEPEITVTGCNKELVSQTAASIESMTRRANFDRRIFQDGIYITNKDSVDMK